MVCLLFLLLVVPAALVSPRGGDVAIYVFNINQSSSPTPFHSVPASVYVSRQLSARSLCSSGTIPVLLVLSIIYI